MGGRGQEVAAAGEAQTLDGEVVVLLVLSNHSQQFVGLEGEGPDEAVLAASDKGVLIDFELNNGRRTMVSTEPGCYWMRST